MVAVLLYVQWNKEEHRAKLSKLYLCEKIQLYSDVIIIYKETGAILKATNQFPHTLEALRPRSQLSPYTAYICDQSRCLR